MALAFVQIYGAPEVSNLAFVQGINAKRIGQALTQDLCELAESVIRSLGMIVNPLEGMCSKSSSPYIVIQVRSQ